MTNGKATLLFFLVLLPLVIDFVIGLVTGMPMSLSKNILIAYVVIFPIYILYLLRAKVVDYFYDIWKNKNNT